MAQRNLMARLRPRRSDTCDGLNRLTAVDQATGTTNDQSWSLDANGNMTSVTTNGSTTNRTHNADNQITQVGASTLSYDNYGNMTVDDSGNILVWDAWNRLVEVTDGSGNLIKAYTYDGLGRKATETDGYTLKDMYYNTSWQLLEEKTGSTTNALYVWSAGYVDALMFRSSSADGSYYAMYDANYNVTGIEASNTVQERFLYSDYGVRTELNASWSSSADSKKWVIGFQGMRWDKETGLFYQRNRWYDPELMRWSSWDPIGYGDGMDPYVMVHNNPISWLDPNGLEVVGGFVVGNPVAVGHFGTGTVRVFTDGRFYRPAKIPRRDFYDDSPKHIVIQYSDMWSGTELRPSCGSYYWVQVVASNDYHVKDHSPVTVVVEINDSGEGSRTTTYDRSFNWHLDGYTKPYHYEGTGTKSEHEISTSDGPEVGISTGKAPDGTPDPGGAYERALQAYTYLVSSKGVPVWTIGWERQANKQYVVHVFEPFNGVTGILEDPQVRLGEFPIGKIVSVDNPLDASARFRGIPYRRQGDN